MENNIWVLNETETKAFIRALESIENYQPDHRLKVNRDNHYNFDEDDIITRFKEKYIGSSMKIEVEIE